MLTQELIRKYLDETVKAIQTDAAEKNQPIPPLRVEVTELGGQLISTDYFQYLVLGRGPGKMPPVENIEANLKKRGIQGRKDNGQFMTHRSLAWAIAKSIEKHGTQIFQKKKPGIDFLGAIDENMDSLLKAIGRNEAFNFLTGLKKELNVIDSH